MLKSKDDTTESERLQTQEEDQRIGRCNEKVLYQEFVIYQVEQIGS